MKTQIGFTLVELIIVLVLVGILSSYAVVRTSDSDSLLLQSYADQFSQHIKHTQMLAMTWGQSLGLSVNSAGYQVSCLSAASTPPCNSSPVIDPATGQLFTISVGDKVVFLDSGSIAFDALGRPLQAGLVSGNVSHWRLAKGSFQVDVSVNPITGSVRR